ncbi:acyl-CoA synthetase [Methylotenera sp.]|uniref:LpxL/LpxP family acyltransferase n=1 Tax=Methylotenera sp. TaxID=2051956 RepID=UPI0027308ED5|nr:acyl-CoA synthetase [Methylotenera sp.]MDP2229311.1 acyl-CoA synthetase [Methylotenera sp.]MDP3141885.1 acyl-CoA synthetase [Methylotenera sp.]
MTGPIESTDKKSAPWLKTQERSNMLMLRIMSWISLRLGRRIARLVLHLIALYFVLFAPDSRRASLGYLPRVLGRPATWLDLYRHFFCFASTIHDRIYLINRRYDLFDIEIHGKENIHPLIDAGKGVLLMGAHLGSFEVMRAIGRQLPGLRVAMVMHEDNAQKINSMLAAINPEASMDIIPLGRIDSMLQVQERLEDGMLVGMLSDRTLGNEPMAQVNLLGATAALPTGPFRMAALLRRPVVFMVGLYMGGNRYQIHFETLADFSDTPRGQRDQAVEIAIARYTELLNRYTRLAPYNWFNFFDYWQSVPASLNEKGE